MKRAQRLLPTIFLCTLLLLAMGGHALAQEDAALPKVKLELTDVKINDAGENVEWEDGDSRAVQPGQRLRYTITVTNVSTDENAVLKDPVIIDLMPEFVDFDISRVRVETSDGCQITADQPTQDDRYIYCKLTGELKPNEYASVTIDCTVGYWGIGGPLEEVVSNTAYVISLYELPVNENNPTGVSFTDENGNLPTNEVVFGDAGTPDANVYMGLCETIQHTLLPLSHLTVYKWVSADVSGLDNYFGSRGYATASAGGQINYNLILTNESEEPVYNIRIMDKLPTVGDTIIAYGWPRNSMWRAYFKRVDSVELVDATGGRRTLGANEYTVWYTSQDESDLSYVNALENGGQNTSGWTTTMPDDVKAFMVELVDQDYEFVQGERIYLSFTCHAPELPEAVGAFSRMAVNDAWASGQVIDTRVDASPGSRRTLFANIGPLVNVMLVSNPMVLRGTKIFAGGDLANTQFEFVLTSTGANADPDFVASYPDGMTTTSDATGAFVFDRINYDTADVGKTYVYTMAETNTGIAGVQYDTKVYTIAVGITDNGGGSIVVTPTITDQTGSPVTSITFENKAPGSVTVTKRTAGNGAMTGPYEFEMELRDTDDTVLTGTVSGTITKADTSSVTGDYTLTNGAISFELNKDETFTVSDLATGTKYAIEETNYTMDGYTTEVQDTNGNPAGQLSNNRLVVGTIEQGAIHEYVYTNTRNVGNLTISKTVAGNAGDNQKDFRFVITLHNTEGFDLGKTYPCTGVDGLTDVTFTSDPIVNNTYASEPILLKHGQSLTIQGIEAGTQFTVVEDDYTGDGYTTTPVSRMLTGTITTGTTATAAFTNTKNEYGDLDVSKTVGGNAADENKQFGFTLRLSRTDNLSVNGAYETVLTHEDSTTTNGTITVSGGSATFTLKRGQTLHINDILSGTAYEVEENDYTADGYTTTPANRMLTGTITTGTPRVAAFENTRNVSNLTVTKTLEGDGTDPNRDFTFTVHLSRTDSATVSGEYPHVVDGEDRGTITVDASGNTQLTLRGGQTATISGILVGTAYTVTETQANQNGYVTTQTGSSGTITTAGSTAAFTNTRNATGTLTVRNVVTGNAAGATHAFNFTIALNDPTGAAYSGTLTTTGAVTELTFTNGSAQFTLSGGESLTIHNVPTSSTYTITETEANQNGYTTTSTGETGEITGGVEPIAVTFENRYIGSSTPPQTGDNTNLWLLMALCCAAAAGLGTCVALGRRRAKAARR